LQRKGRALDATADVIAALRRHALPEDQRLIDQLAEARARLSRATLAGPGREGIEKHRADLQALEEQVEKLEVELSQRSTEFRVQSMPVTIELVQKRIPAEGALVEYAAYRPFNPKAAKKDEQYGKAHYAAYVLRDQGEALWVELGEAAAIDEKINAFRQALRNKQPTVRRLARSVDKLVMQPVLRLLGPTRRVFLSPDGALSLIPFAALIDERGEYLVKRYSFTYLTTGRDLLRLQNKVQGKSAKMIIADPAFGKEVMAGVNTPTTGMLGEYVFRPLTATREEARDLKRLFPGATVLIGARATETVIKAADRPAILHIATHGFFLRDEQELVATGEGEKTRLAVRRKEPPQGKSVVSQELVNPLMRSGLALAGANERKGGNGEDGILTASEVAGLDLWGTKLVVLSACDTGVGKVVSGDGVYGLRRALVLAGSESQMMSLWPVSDTGTRELMIEYYKRLKAGEGRSEALRRVQLKMLASKNRNHPFYWASFIQSGEWANLDGKRVD
jgi:CHAT domain-containing protein